MGLILILVGINLLCFIGAYITKHSGIKPSRGLNAMCNGIAVLACTALFISLFALLIIQADQNPLICKTHHKLNREVELLNKVTDQSTISTEYLMELSKEVERANETIEDEKEIHNSFMMNIFSREAVLNLKPIKFNYNMVYIKN